jgi:glycosyltransferase involved in cell wall biosynthesis
LEKKNILFISSWFPNKLEPTNGNFVQRHAEAVSLLHDVEILHTIGNFNQNEKFVLDDQIINEIRTLIIYYKNTKNPILNFFRRMKAYKMGFLKMKKPDLVHANVLHNSMFFAVYLKKKFKIPFVVTEHWTALQTENHQNTSKKIIKTARFIGNRASYILPVSNNLLISLTELKIIGSKKVISNVVNTQIFDIAIKNNTLPTFLHISSLIPRKKADRIIATAKKLYDDGYRFILEIGGDGDFKTLENEIYKLEAQHYIKTFGEISYQKVAEKMQQSDCFILFSENETQGCVILESFACGVPVIATKVGGVPEFIKENFGILIEKNNEAELYDAMKDIIEKKIQFERPVALREFVVANYSKESIAEQFSAIYKEILK